MRHSFYRFNFGDIFATRWKCANCGIKVPGSAAKQLEGMRCR